MKIFSTRKKRISVIVAAIMIAALGTGVAYAYWSSSGTGTGSATTGTSSSFTVASSAPTGGPLSPAGPSETVAFTVTNPGSGNQNLTSVVVTVAGAGGAAWSSVAGCSNLDYTVGTPAITYGTIAPAGSASGTVTVTMNNLGSNQDGCKLATVPLYFVAS
jgi:predicted ribosomally synthesized peptide with SipW-like signal peptide